MTTARDIIDLAFFDAGIYGTGQTAPGPDANKALVRMNEMISQWQRNRWLVYVLADVSAAMTGAVSYLIGAGQTFATPRPDRIEAAFVRQTTQAAPYQLDTQLELVQSREAFSNIVMKQLASFPRYLFYESSFPYGRLYPWPLPSSQYALHVLVKEALQTFAALDTVFSMPEEYKAALRWNLQEVLMSAYRMPAEERVTRFARSSLNIIRNANTQIPTLTLPPELVRPGLYNIMSDSSG